MANKLPHSKRAWRGPAPEEVPKLAVLVLVVASLFACARRDPQAAYDHAWKAFQHGDFVRAEQEARRGSDEFRKSAPPWVWKFVILRARTLYQRGMYDDVLTVLASEQSVVPSGELAIQKYRFEGLAHLSLHHFQEAEQRFDEAERLCAVSTYPVCADIVSARGKLQMERGHYAQAQDLFERVLSAARASGDQVWVADALLDLSWSANSQAHFDEVLDWSDAAYHISVERGIPSIEEVALGNMGWAYYKLGDRDRAVAMFTEAEQRAANLGMAASQAGWLTDLGYVYMDSRHFNFAEQSFLKSLDIVRKIKSQEDIINSLIALAFVSEQTGKLGDAQRYANEALAMARADGNKRDEVYPRLVQGRVAARTHDSVDAEGAFREVASAPDAPVFLKWEAEHSLARLYEDENRPAAAEREYRASLSTFEAARKDLRKTESRLPFLSNATAIYDDYIRFLVTRGQRDEALQVADFSRARTLSEGLGLLPQETSFKPYPLDAAHVARRAGGTILFYWLGEKQSYLWAITPRKISLFSLPPALEIEAAVQRYRNALTGPQDVLGTGSDTGRSLYRMLIAPARTQLPKGAKVLIIPDGGLTGLNFETLLVSEPKLHYWVEDVTIANASSLRLLAASHAGKEKSGRSLLLFGNTVAPSQEYPQLSNAAAEIESVAKHFPLAQRQVFQGDQATPAAYLAGNLDKFSYIHFVAHGIASQVSPLDSAIVLSKNGAGDDSFKLYARDIIQHPVQAELVTISACYGAGTRAYTGEGLVGLSWAFLRAGAHNVVAALWEASDVSTRQLMDQFYEELNRGVSPDVALRKAKLSLLRSGSSLQKPFYWAAFQLYTGS